jgi:DNA-binding Lrp family transcriptional regulator
MGGEHIMRQKAYVLIDSVKGEARSVAAELTGKPGIISADVIFGHHDPVAVIEADDVEGLLEIVRYEICSAEHVVHTETLLVASPRERQRKVS